METTSLSTTPDVQPADVLSFWFRGATDDTHLSPDREPASLWFTKKPEFDDACRHQFGEAAERALNGRLDAWRATPEGTLALVLLLDQIPRNIFRNHGRAFAGDTRAVDLVIHALAEGQDKRLPLIQRQFLYMPLMHSESLEIHETAREKFEELLELSTRRAPHLAPMFQSALDYEDKHAAIIRRFGRYPHRNASLGRRSTPEELEFLKGPDSSF